MISYIYPTKPFPCSFCSTTILISLVSRSKMVVWNRLMLIYVDLCTDMTDVELSPLDQCRIQLIEFIRISGVILSIHSHDPMTQPLTAHMLPSSQLNARTNQTYQDLSITHRWLLSSSLPSPLTLHPKFQWTWLICVPGQSGVQRPSTILLPATNSLSLRKQVIPKVTKSHFVCISSFGVAGWLHSKYLLIHKHMAKFSDK